VSIGFRHADHRYPFLWETGAQPAGRWHADGEGPCQYLADTPDGAWAEFLRREEIQDPADLPGITRSLWAIDVPDPVLAGAHHLPTDTTTAAPDMTGGPGSYPACQDYARAQRGRGVTGLVAPSAALLPGAAGGQVTDNGLRDAENRDGATWVLFGTRPQLRGWRVVDKGAPPSRVLDLTRHLD
jgi:hypothetical protein